MFAGDETYPTKIEPQRHQACIAQPGSRAKDHLVRQCAGQQGVRLAKERTTKTEEIPTYCAGDEGALRKAKDLTSDNCDSSAPPLEP